MQTFTSVFFLLAAVAEEDKVRHSFTSIAPCIMAFVCLLTGIRAAAPPPNSRWSRDRPARSHSPTTPPQLLSCL